MTISDQLREQALAAGFDSVGICPAAETRRWDAFLAWLAKGYAGTMNYLPGRKEAYRHPAGVLEGCQTVVMLTMNYLPDGAARAAAGEGLVSRYAVGRRDYHDVIRAKLKELGRWLRSQQPGCRVRGVVDTAPLFEREFAERAGLGWIGKHTLLLNREQGSWFFLAALLTDLVLPTTDAEVPNHCGSCRACLDACPTDAFVAPYELDARSCISYLTIEHRGPIPLSLRGGVGDWVFGCDVCQEVCPWNRRAPLASESPFEEGSDRLSLELLPLFDLDEEAFATRFRGTPLSRPGRSGILRNAAIVLGNQHATCAVTTLCRALDDVDPIVRGAVAWALGRLGTDESQGALRRRMAIERDITVLHELDAALTT